MLFPTVFLSPFLPLLPPSSLLSPLLFLFVLFFKIDRKIWEELMVKVENSRCFAFASVFFCFFLFFFSSPPLFIRQFGYFLGRKTSMIRTKDWCQRFHTNSRVILRQSEVVALDIFILILEGTYGLCICFPCYVYLRTLVDLVYWFVMIAFYTPFTLFLYCIV